MVVKRGLMLKRITMGNTARNEVLKALGAWLRAISLGLMAVAFIDPLRNPANFQPNATGIGLVGALISLGLSLWLSSRVRKDS